MPAGTVSKAGDGQRPIYDNDCLGPRYLKCFLSGTRLTWGPWLVYDSNLCRSCTECAADVKAIGYLRKRRREQLPVDPQSASSECLLCTCPPSEQNDFSYSRDSHQSSCFSTPVRGEGNGGSTLPPWVIPNTRTPGSFSSPPGGTGALPAARHPSHRSSLATGALAMTAIPDGNSSKPGDGAGADSGRNRLQRDGESYGGVHATGADKMNTSDSGAESAGRRENIGARRHAPPAGRGRGGAFSPGTPRATPGAGTVPPQSSNGQTRDGGGDSGARGEAGAWAATDPESFLRENLSLKDLVSLAYMFNFVEAGVLGLGERKAVVQVRSALTRFKRISSPLFLTKNLDLGLRGALKTLAFATSRMGFMQRGGRCSQSWES